MSVSQLKSWKWKMQRVSYISTMTVQNHLTYSKKVIKNPSKTFIQNLFQTIY